MHLNNGITNSVDTNMVAPDEQALSALRLTELLDS